MNKSFVKHNKRRNTSFLYETLVLEFTSSILKKDEKRKQEILNILKEFFSSGKILKQEIDIFQVLNNKKQNNNFDENKAKYLLFEAKREYDKLDKNIIFQQQTKLLNKINKKLGNKIFDNFIPDYKYLASLSVILNGQGKIDKRIILEQEIIKRLSCYFSNKNNKEGEEQIKFKQLESMDKISFKILMKKFDEKYKDKLLKEQKELLSNYVLGFSDNNLSLKVYLNEEIRSFKKRIK